MLRTTGERVWECFHADITVCWAEGEGREHTVDRRRRRRPSVVGEPFLQFPGCFWSEGKFSAIAALHSAREIENWCNKSVFFEKIKRQNPFFEGKNMKKRKNGGIRKRKENCFPQQKREGESFPTILQLFLSRKKKKEKRPWIVVAREGPFPPLYPYSSREGRRLKTCPAADRNSPILVQISVTLVKTTGAKMGDFLVSTLVANGEGGK